MPAKHLIVQKSTRKRLSKLPVGNHIRILNAIEKIQKNPLIGPKLKGELADYYKFRVGDYRIVYSFNPKTSTVEVVKIEHRQGVYK